MNNGISVLTEFWKKLYLLEYIKEGGSKIKFVTGQERSGKTFFVEELTSIAKECNYLTVCLTAKETWLNNFNDFYVSIFNNAEVEDLIKRASTLIIKEMGYNPEDVKEGTTFVDLLATHEDNNALTKKAIRELLTTYFLNNPRFDNNFGVAISLLVGEVLGHPQLEKEHKDTLYSWLSAKKEVKITDIKKLEMNPYKITKYNARQMLRSLSELCHLAGYNGLFIAVDDIDVLVEKSGLNTMHYTKRKRDDTYESMRALIDDIDNFSNIFVLYAFDSKLIEMENEGLKSYQALWMRIQNEVKGNRFNKFTDIVDMDSLNNEVYDTASVIALSQCVIDAFDLSQDALLKETEAEDILVRAKQGGMPLPGLIEDVTLEKGGLLNE